MKKIIKSAIWNIEKKEIRTAKRKKQNSKEMKIVQGASGTTSSILTFAPQRCQEEKRKGKKLEIYLKK